MEDEADEEHQGSETPESSEDSREKTVIMADSPEGEGLQVPEPAQNIGEQKDDQNAAGSVRSSGEGSDSRSDHQSNIQADADHGVPSANQAIASKQSQSGIASHHHDDATQSAEKSNDATSLPTLSLPQDPSAPEESRPTVHKQQSDSIKKRKREDGELSSSESEHEDHEGIAAQDSVKGTLIQHAGPRDSEITQ